MTLRELGRSVGNAVFQRVGRAASKVQETRPLPADLLESDDAYLVVFDAPGATGSDVQVRFADGAVLVRLDRFREFHEGFGMVFPGRGMSLDGRVELPPDGEVDANAASATLTDSGTLEVRVPKETQSAEA
ncbi:Hsp20/alpha crystallin family protein [Halomicrococcus sp. NG-SE-24]|uniref:Hsp20/alpha crystallin family protein n=1 Tax=Halomicrococcus sp. NG-SE-24 TaxID=3436928 RepID=UPI003D961DA2